MRLVMEGKAICKKGFYEIWIWEERFPQKSQKAQKRQLSQRCLRFLRETYSPQAIILRSSLPKSHSICGKNSVS